MPDPNIEATAQAVLGQLRRVGVTVGTGLTGYDLQTGAKRLYPVLTPLRNKLPRVKGQGGLATIFKAITAINSLNVSPGVGEGHRNGANTTAVMTRAIPYASIGHDDVLSFEAIDAAFGWENLPTTVKETLLQSLMIDEEKLLLWGAGGAITTQSGAGVISAALGRGTVASTSAPATGGTLPNSTTYTIYVMPLTYEGVQYAGGYFSSGASGYNGPVAPFSRSNMGASSDTVNGGCGQISAAVTQATTAGTGANSIVANATNIPGAAGYAWFIGTSAGNAAIAAVTSLPTFTFVSATDVGSVLASTFVSLAADNSVNIMEYTGLIPYIAGSPLSYKIDGQGAALASDGGRNVAQILQIFKKLWDGYRTGYDDIWVSATKAVEIDQIITKNASGSNNFLAVVDGTKGADAGMVLPGPARAIPNPYSNTNVRINVHPYLTDNIMLFTKDSVPFPANGVANPWEYHYQRDYYGQDWPVNNRQYEYGVYTRGALALNAEMLFGMVHNLAA